MTLLVAPHDNISFFKTIIKDYAKLFFKVLFSKLIKINFNSEMKNILIIEKSNTAWHYKT